MKKNISNSGSSFPENRSTDTATVTAPTHDEITTRARELWEKYGQPSGRDEEIWLEAETQLSSANAVRRPPANSTAGGSYSIRSN